MAKTLDGAVGSDTHPSGQAPGKQDIDLLVTSLIARRRRLVALLGVPALVCYASYLALSVWGAAALRTGLGGLSVGWLAFAVMLLLPGVICTLYARRSTSVLDPLRERIAPPADHVEGGSR